MGKYKNDDYLFATAYMRCREKFFLTSEKVDKMLDSKTPDDALKVLYDLEYGDGTEVSPREFEVLLSKELEKTYGLILPLVPYPEFFSIFLYPNDYHNIKVLLKAEFLGTHQEDILTDTGSVPLARLTDLVRNRNYTDMRLEMAKGIQEVIDTYATSQDPQVIDLILDRVCYEEINLTTAQLKNNFVRGYIALKIDAINLKSFVRAKEMKKPWDFFANIFIEGGNIPERLFISGYDEALEQFAEKLGIYGFSQILLEGALMIKETGRFTALEKLCDNHIVDYAREAKYVAYGIQPLIGYLVAKENEIKTARIIMAGKLANIPTEQITERIRSAYV